MKMNLTAAMVAGSFLLLGTTARADDWPQWRGPTRDGISKETGLLIAWPKEGPKLVWQTKGLGGGFSTPAIAGGKVYLLGNEGLDKESVEALDATDGKKIWATQIGKVGNPDQQPNYPGARSTPTVDGDMIYALGSDGDLVCLEAATGNVKWKKNLRTDFGGEPGRWAYAESPLVDGDKVICTPGGKDATLIALNKNTGEVIWKCPIAGGEQAAYSSISAVTINGAKEYVQFVQKGVVGVDAKNGALLWRYDKTAAGSAANIPTPIISDGHIYSATSMGMGGLIQIKNGNEVEPGYTSKKLPNAIGGAVKIGNYMYGTTQTSLQCVDFLTGEVKWDDRSVGAGSLCFADGRLYLHGENGEVALVDAAPDGYKEFGRFTPANGDDRGQAKAWSYPVVANGRLYIHDAGSVWCYNVKAK